MKIKKLQPKTIKLLVIIACMVLVTVVGLAVTLKLVNQDGVHKHTYIWHDEVEPTCTSDGKQGYYSCDSCELVFDKDKNEVTLASLTIKGGHVFKDLVCIRCDMDLNELVDAIEALPEDGYTFADIEIINALKAQYDELDDDIKKEITNIEKLEEAITAISGIEIVAGADMIMNGGQCDPSLKGLHTEIADVTGIGKVATIHYTEWQWGNFIYDSQDKIPVGTKVAFGIYNASSEAVGMHWGNVVTIYSASDLTTLQPGWNLVSFTWEWEKNALNAECLISDLLYALSPAGNETDMNGWKFTGLFTYTDEDMFDTIYTNSVTKSGEEVSILSSHQGISKIISDLPSKNFTLADVANINAAKEAYDALSDSAKKKVTNVDKLNRAYSAISGIKLVAEATTLKSGAQCEDTLKGFKTEASNVAGLGDAVTIRYKEWQWANYRYDKLVIPEVGTKVAFGIYNASKEAVGMHWGNGNTLYTESNLVGLQPGWNLVSFTWTWKEGPEGGDYAISDHLFALSPAGNETDMNGWKFTGLFTYTDESAFKTIAANTIAKLGKDNAGIANEHVHKYVWHKNMEATCTTDGRQGYYTCEGCDKIFNAEKKQVTFESLTIEGKHQFVNAVCKGCGLNVEGIIEGIENLSLATVGEVVAQYNALSEADKALVTNADKLAAFKNMTVISADKLTNDVDFGAVEFNVDTDTTYGKYSELTDQQTDWVNVYYNSDMILTGLTKELVVYIYNPMVFNVDVAFGNIAADKGNDIFGTPDNCFVRATLKAQNWTKVVIDWPEQNTTHIELSEVRMVLVNSEEMAAGNYTALTGFKISSMYIVDDAATLDTLIPKSDEEEVLNEPVDFYVEVEEGRDPVVLQLTDPQIIDAAQARSEDRLGAEYYEYWATDKTEERCYSYIRETINNTNPDLILITGDIIYGEFDDNGTAWQSFIEFMDSFEIPWAPILGNHEIESTKGVDWQCEQLENSEYCLFKQRTLTGNGNYTVGIKQGEKLQRVFFMVDSNGSSAASAESLANGHTITATGFGEDQIAWYTETAQQIKANWPDAKLSFAFHIPFQAFIDASEKYDAPIYIDAASTNTEGDFGYLPGTAITGWDTDYRVWNGLKALGVDSIFIGHMHTYSASIVYEGVRLQYGQKSSTYDALNFVDGAGTIVQTTGGDMNGEGIPLVGGTVLPLSKDNGAIVNPYIYLCEDINWDSFGTVVVPASKLTNDSEYGAVTFTIGTDEAYGEYSEFTDQQTNWVNVYYDSTIKLTGLNKDLVVYIYNPLDSAVDVAFGNIASSQGNGIFGAPDNCYARATLKAKAWTRVVIEWTETYTNDIELNQIRMVVVNSEEMAAGNYTDLTGFKMSSMYIVDNADELEDPSAAATVEELIHAIDNMTLATLANEYKGLLEQYNALSEEDKALVTNAEKLTAFEKMTVISAETLTHDINYGAVTFTTGTDATYGTYSELTDQQTNWVNVYYDSNKLLRGLNQDLVVYIYNPLSTDVDVAFGNIASSQGNGIFDAPDDCYVRATLTAQAWTKVVIEWSAEYINQIALNEVRMVLVGSETMAAGNYTSLTGFKMSSMYIVDDAAALDDLIPKSKVQEVIEGIDELSLANLESVLAKYNALSDTEKAQVTNADKLTAFENMTVISADKLMASYATMSITTGTDATYGVYSELNETDGWADVYFNSEMILTGLNKDLVFYVYNPLDSEVDVAFGNIYDTIFGPVSGCYASATLQPKTWTKVVIDWTEAYTNHVELWHVRMVVVNDANSCVAGNYDIDLTGFKMSSMYIVDDADILY